MMFLPQALRIALGGVREVEYISNKGNAGDALIAAATSQVLSRLGVRVASGAKTTLVAGGGNLNPRYQCLEKAIHRLPRSGKKIIILPSTVVGCFPLLAAFDDLTLMCREELTGKLARLSGIRTMQVHDAAFSFDYVPWNVGERPGGHRILRAYRSDLEGTGRPAGVDGNRDLSAEIGEGRWLLEGSIGTARRFIDAISGYDEIETDRSHVAIAGANLGKTVRVFPGAYFKNRAIFEASLAAFPKVSFEQ